MKASFLKDVRGDCMPFLLESEIADAAIYWLHSQQLAVKREFPTPWGVCDLVAASLNRHYVAKRLRSGQTRSSVFPPPSTDPCSTSGFRSLRTSASAFVFRQPR